VPSIHYNSSLFTSDGKTLVVVDKSSSGCWLAHYDTVTGDEICERRGVTPLTLELPRGPHSMRAEYQGEEVPVQVIDLPGGNERYASFTFGTGGVSPKLVLKSPLSATSRDATVMSA